MADCTTNAPLHVDVIGMWKDFMKHQEHDANASLSAPLAPKDGDLTGTAQTHLRTGDPGGRGRKAWSRSGRRTWAACSCAPQTGEGC